ncbi:hypothetical protein Taro_029408, partial [Colocasia esculenta]|nr:hypothetical protein [Colocasia esculenta]
STNASNVPTSSKIQKSQGKFKGLETFKKIRAYNNVKLPVQIDMEFRRPFGENADSLVGEIARLVTLCASFDVSYWRDVPEDRKDKIYEKLLVNVYSCLSEFDILLELYSHLIIYISKCVQDKFELKVGDEVCNDIHIRKNIYEIAGRRYRDVRCTLYHHYQSYATDEARLQNPPEDINANEWAWLVNYFGSSKFKAMSERNKVNHSKQVISHVTGRRSFKQVSWTERNEEGEEPAAHELWRLTHQKKDGAWGSEHSREVYETVKDKLEELASQSCDSPVASTLEEVLSSVVGQRSGHVRGRGCGPKPPSKSATTVATIAGLQSQVKDKEERMIQ